jgi:hypothetical protein
MVKQRIFLSAVLILSLLMVSSVNPLVIRGQSNSAFGDYQITALTDQPVLNGRELDKYLISYEKPEMKLIVAVDRQKKCRKYYVLSGLLPVEDNCNGSLFGIKKLGQELVDKGFDTDLTNLNKQEYYRQRILTDEHLGTVDQLNLIASYYPGLLNEKVL